MSQLGSRAISPDTALNETEQRLQAQFEKLEGQFAQLRDQTRQMQRFASLGTAAAMLAHEFNNLMTPVIGYAQYALNHNDTELMVKALRMAVKQIGIITGMSDRILGLARGEAQSMRPVAVKEAVDDAIACLGRDPSKDGITLTVEVEDGLRVLADPGQLQQVLFNLLINARQAIENRNGRITISATRPDDEHVAIAIRDTGCGIPADQINTIFDAFVSTKTDRPGKSGMGLGLALCREIVEEHRGRITVESQVDAGSTFTVTLPSA